MLADLLQTSTLAVPPLITDSERINLGLFRLLDFSVSCRQPGNKNNEGLGKVKFERVKIMIRQ